MARSIRKGPYVAPCLLERIKKSKTSGKREVIKTWKRASMVIPEMVGLTIAVHDGRKFISVFVTENMVGHVLGEFAPTRTFRVHSGQRKAEKASGIAAPAAPSGQAAGSAPAAPAAASAPAK
jgi:small subunit ribosomal protein S19